MKIVVIIATFYFVTPGMLSRRKKKCYLFIGISWTHFYDDLSIDSCTSII